MATRSEACDLCLGSNLAPYRAPAPPGRELFCCCDCSLVTALPRTIQMERSGGRVALEKHPLRDHRSDRRRASAVMRLIPSGRILEVDCERGYFLSALDPVRYETLGLEADPELAADAQSRLSGARLRGAVVAGTLQGAKLASASFDLVAIFGSLGKAASPRALLMEVSRLLKDGGHVVIETPSLTSLTARLRGARWQPLRDPDADYFFSPSSLERLGSVTGFSGGTIRMPMPVRWPSPGTLVYIARKTAVPYRQPSLVSLSDRLHRMSPARATD